MSLLYKIAQFICLMVKNQFKYFSVFKIRSWKTKYFQYLISILNFFFVIFPLQNINNKPYKYISYDKQFILKINQKNSIFFHVSSMFSYIESQRNNLKAQTNKQQNSCFINYLELQPFIIQLKLQQMMTDIQIEPNPQNQLQIWNNFYLQQSQIEHKHILDQDFYLSQFICETKYSKQSSHQQAQNDAKFIGNLQKHQKQEEQFTISPKKSVFHNFQKHLLITLKQQITKKLLKNQSQLAKKMWNIFLDSNQFNKQILVVLFSKNYQKTLNLIEDKYGFAQIQRKNDPFDITEAQQSLKQLILNHFRTFPIEDMLQKRRLDPFQKTQLIQYIKQFLMELMNDNIQRRLPKKKQTRHLKPQVTCRPIC